MSRCRSGFVVHFIRFEIFRDFHILSGGVGLKEIVHRVDARVMKERPKTEPNSRIPGLDGLRALSVLLVVVSHVLLSISPNELGRWEVLRPYLHGGLGVLFFFVISGYVITRMLLREWQEFGSVSVAEFYKRRVIRLFPAAALFVVTTSVLSLGMGQEVSSRCLLTAFTFSEGVFRQCDWNLAHLWSLTAEELFYLGWPFLFLRVQKKPGLRWYGITVACCATLRVALYLANRRGLNFPIDFSIVTHFDQMATGSLLALLEKRYPQTLSRVFQRWGALPWTGVAVIIGIQGASHLGCAGWLLLPFGPLLKAIAFASIMASFTFRPAGVLFNIATTRVATTIGLLSYSLYLWQQPFFRHVASGSAVPGWLTESALKCLWIFGLAWGSYTFVEVPIRKFAEKRGWLVNRRRRTDGGTNRNLHDSVIKFRKC